MLLVNATSIAADHDAAYRLRRAGEILPLVNLIKIAQNLHPGELLEAELERRAGRYVYEIEIAGDDGRFYDLYFDAATGELLQNTE
jgi:uncharacterized membrane protein YkoI